MILETKFDVGSEVFFLADEKIVQGEVTYIEIKLWKNDSDNIKSADEVYQVKYSYSNSSGTKSEAKITITRDNLFKSIDDLIGNLKSNIQFLPGSDYAELNKWGQA
mgnify:CR=1 FL=1